MIPDHALRVFLKMLTSVRDECYLLRTFALHRRTRLYNPDPLRMLDSMFVTAPSLSTLRLFPFINASFPWSQISVLETSFLSVDEELMVIKNAPLLRTLKTSRIYMSSRLRAPDPVPFVQTSLVYFVPVSEFYVGKDQLDAISGFFRRSRPPLLSFSIFIELQHPTLSDDLIRQIFDALSPIQTLVKLKLELGFPTSEHDCDLESIFHVLQGSLFLFPMLERLVIQAWKGICSLGDILALVLSRETIHPLKTLTVDCAGLAKMNRKATFSCLERLRDFRHRGLQLTLIVNETKFDWESYVVGPSLDDTF
ncbi:uncharacterized protein BT62DRAFT_737361 [Guyanagaster necrorhizus]|uniref:Uncharacterized protein n=1 Tax=Guyanagaster necrorhizus TaxID=856835 RepID=A0A9P8AKQ2_9AGAR|nr:uncharacterized protein BT62DRAFT_737361 [Guyanagaster necrorhizus MCA 3950]KAG7439443.1 hypothetical protein BT62DRAFT_737361 [Guyanagaster necrorhizus MCA 3950]